MPGMSRAAIIPVPSARLGPGPSREDIAVDRSGRVLIPDFRPVPPGDRTSAPILLETPR